MNPDDGTPDPFDDEPTSQHDRGTAPEHRPGPVPVSERNTGTYAGSAEFVAGRESGFEAGFKLGVDKAIAALRVELTRAGATGDEIARVIARIRAVALAGR
jgi:hypothetical protein